jgi:hypothetical protein
MNFHRAIAFVLAASLLTPLVAPSAAQAGKAPFYVPTKEERESADYGEFPANYQELVVEYMERVHKTPSTAKYLMIGEPAKGTNWAKKRENVIYCYNISANINPDRSWNGYTLWTFFIKNGKVIGEYKT